MLSPGSITLSRKECNQIEVFERLKQKEITQRQAGMMLGMSDRWIRAKSKRYKCGGPNGLIHRNRGRSSPLKWDKQEKSKVLSYVAVYVLSWFLFCEPISLTSLAGMLLIVMGTGLLGFK